MVHTDVNNIDCLFHKKLQNFSDPPVIKLKNGMDVISSVLACYTRPHNQQCIQCLACIHVIFTTDKVISGFMWPLSSHKVMTIQ